MGWGGGGRGTQASAMDDLPQHACQHFLATFAPATFIKHSIPSTCMTQPTPPACPALQEKGKVIDRRKHHVLTAAHPSGLSANRGFFGCRHFSQTNKLLERSGQLPIDWCEGGRRGGCVCSSCDISVGKGGRRWGWWWEWGRIGGGVAAMGAARWPGDCRGQLPSVWVSRNLYLVVHLEHVLQHCMISVEVERNPGVG